MHILINVYIDLNFFFAFNKQRKENMKKKVRKKKSLYILHYSLFFIFIFISKYEVI